MLCLVEQWGWTYFPEYRKLASSIVYCKLCNKLQEKKVLRHGISS